jgi:hypothetical protein
MRTTDGITALAKHRARHFDRGLRSALPAVALLAACSGSLNTSNDPGNAGSGGSAGGIRGECGAWSGAGNCATGGSTGPGGTWGFCGTGGFGETGVGGAGGNGGTTPLPACTVFGPAFGVCFANDMEQPTTTTDLRLTTSGAATIESVGAGAAPASCVSAHGIGTTGSGQWWIQARAADNRLWTIGAAGLGAATPPVRVGDTVSLDLNWREYSVVPAAWQTEGKLQVADAAGTPLLWAGANAAETWISFANGDYACAANNTPCDTGMRNVIATVNGSSVTLPPYGAASVGDYSVRVTHFSPFCGDYQQPFEAAAARVSPTTGP